MENHAVISYAVYLTLSIAMTIWVAHTLHRNGRIFLVDAFGGHEKLADSVNHLLVVGFYLINVGYIALSLRYGEKPATVTTAIEFVSTKVGLVMLVLGAMHFGNIFVFHRMRSNRMLQDAPPPIAPDDRTELPDHAQPAGA